MVGVLLDTCVLSELRLPEGEPRVRQRVDAFETEAIYVSAITLGEVAKGVALLADGRRKEELASWLLVVEQHYAGRVLPIDLDVARIWGEVTARAQRQGFNIPILDGLIAATALAHGLHVMTRNTKDFIATGALIIDPWD